MQSLLRSIYLRTLLIAGAIFLLLVACTLWWLSHYTRHGQAESVPDLRGLDLAEAATVLRQKSLRFQVVDSVFDRNKTRGSVVEHTPPANSLVKKERIIFLTVNARETRKVAVPDLRDNSYRQVVATLKSLEFEVAEIVRQSSEYKDLVLDITHNGRSVASGVELPVGSRLTVIVGDGMGSGSAEEDTIIIDENEESWF